jgi:hypothetical protein
VTARTYKWNGKWMREPGLKWLCWRTPAAIYPPQEGGKTEIGEGMEDRSWGKEEVNSDRGETRRKRNVRERREGDKNMK